MMINLRWEDESGSRPGEGRLMLGQVNVAFSKHSLAKGSEELTMYLLLPGFNKEVSAHKFVESNTEAMRFLTEARVRQWLERAGVES